MGETFTTSVASNLVSKLLEGLFAPIGRQFGYVLCYKSYVKDLVNGVKELETAQERVEHSVQEAMYNGKPIETDIENWLKRVKEETEKAGDLLNRNRSAKHACFRGSLPNPMVRHPIGRKVKKMTQVIQGLHDKSKNSIFQKVFYENTPIGTVTATTSAARYVHRGEDILESRASSTDDVIKAITNDEFCVIGVYGPGGVGKSKLMEDVTRRVKNEKLFDVVATINVLRNPDLKRIQGEIAYALGLKLINEETIYGRADLLYKRLEEYFEKKILIILDNLWSKLELKEVGIPCKYDNKVRGCKLLVTSRYRNILYNGMCSDQEFRLSELMHGEARMLFEKTVGDRVNVPQFKSLVDRVVENCGGLPLLIISVAKRLKHGNLPEWKDASTNKDGPSVKSIVELSYNDLEDERIKSLFLICALHSRRPSIRDTLIYCMGLGLFKTISKTIENARDRLIMDLRRLLDSSLLLDSDDLEQWSMHDLFSDVAISMHGKFIDTDWNALVGRKDFGFREWSEYDLRKCTTMAFNYVGIDELPEKLDCPNMRILLLFERNRLLKIPESFFESMGKLPVLDLTGLSFTFLPTSMEFLENLTSLCLDQCHLEDVTALGKLKRLQFLSFKGSTIARLPKEMGEIIELRFLDMRECSMLEVIEPGVLESLFNLEELYMQNSFDQWEAADKTPRSNASLAELKNLKKLSTLQIDISNPTNLSRGLPFGKPNMHNIQIRRIEHPRGITKNPVLLEGLQKESKNSIFQKVHYENAPIGIVTATTSATRSVHKEEDILESRASRTEDVILESRASRTEDVILESRASCTQDVILESRASRTEDVIKAITNDEFCVIGVYGPCGVGKSKLMEDIERRVKKEKLFDVVATTNVSRNPDLKRIQGEIAYALGLKLIYEETTHGRADILCKKLEEYSKKKVLIILDNLWSKLELKEVGIPCGYDNKVRGCKLLLTSRYRDILFVEMSSDREFQLSVLKNKEAQILFERTVGDKVNDPQFQNLVDRVVKNCGGLPLLIISVAKRFKRGDLPEWRDALTNEDGSSIKSIVELCYDDLDNERIKSLFLICALLSRRLSTRDILIYCMGLGLIKTISETIENARDRLIMDLRRLLDSSLLLGSDDPEQWSMHDRIINVAISIRDKFIDIEWNALVGRKDFGFKEWSKNDLRKCTAMAFNYVGIDELPEKLDCPNMRILMLLEHNSSLKMPESFFESMEKLQVLDLTGLSFTFLPTSMEFLESLVSLCLDQCHMEDVTALGKLKRLQFLSFKGSSIARLPKEIGELVELRLLDMRECSMLEVIEPGVLESLVNLEELYMQNSFDQWEAADKTPRSNASLVELKNLKKLSTLQIDISDPTNLSKGLPFGKPNMHNIRIRRIEHWWSITKNPEL